MHINDLLKIAASGASDLHLKVGSYPMMRLNGSLVVVSEGERLDRPDTEAIAQAIFSPEHHEKFRKAQEVDLAHSVAPRLPCQRVPAARHRRSRYCASSRPGSRRSMSWHCRRF